MDRQVKYWVLGITFLMFSVGVYLVWAMAAIYIAFQTRQAGREPLISDSFFTCAWLFAPAAAICMVLGLTLVAVGFHRRR